MKPTRNERCGLTLVPGGFRPKRYGHSPEPIPGTIRSARIGSDPERMEYPHEGVCLHCGEVLRLGQEMPIGPIGLWQHTGRKPGEG